MLAHRRREPRTRPFRVNYGISERGVVDDVIAEVTAAAERAVAAGVARDAVLIDPTTISARTLITVLVCCAT